jgi:hypothetical protein
LLVAIAVAAGCGDNRKPGIVVETHVAGSTIAAGQRIDAGCDLVTALGDPALDKDGQPLTDSVEFTISYEASDAFAKDSAGQVIAARAGTAVVRCAAPSLGLIDEDPEQITIVPGAPVRTITQLASSIAVAGDPVGVTCLAFDAFDNAVRDFTPALALSPSGAGTSKTAGSVTATVTGDYEVSCVVPGAADVEGDFLIVVPGLPASLTAAVEPDGRVFVRDDQVTLIAEARDRFGNRVDDVALSYVSNPSLSPPGGPQFKFAADGQYTLTATAAPPTFEDRPLSTSMTVFVNSVGPAIQCRRADDPAQVADAYMLQRAPGTLVVPVHVTATFNVQSVTINGVAATHNASTDNWEAGIPADFGMTFVNVSARDELGRENSTTCFVLAAQSFVAEDAHLGGALGLRLDQNAIGDPDPSGLNSINDLLFTVLGSDQLHQLVDDGIPSTVGGDGCHFFTDCPPRVTYDRGSIGWDRASSELTLVDGGLQANITLPNAHLKVSACSVLCCPGGSDITVTAGTITATVTFSLSLQGGVLRAALQGEPDVFVAEPDLHPTGFCGLIIDVLKSFLTGTVRDAIHDALQSFIASNVAPLIDQLVSSLDINTLGASFAVPRLDGTGNIGLQFGLQFSTFDLSSTRGLLGIGTRFTPSAVGQNRRSLGVPRRADNALLDPPGTGGSQSIGLALYEGALNQVLHSLWRGGFFEATLQFGPGTATIDARLPPVATITGNQAQLMLGGIDATIRIPGIIDVAIPILFGGRATASISLSGDALHFGNLTLTQLFVSVQASLTQRQRDALASLLTQVLQSSLASAINNGLPAFPIPTFALPPSVAQFGLPAGAQLGILNPQLSTSGTHVVLTGGFGVRN